jgi:hypothetical protein
MVRPFACAFWEEEPWSACGCLGDVYVTVINGMYVREGVPPWPVAPIKHPPDVMEADERSQCTGSIPMLSKSTLWQKQLLKLRLPISVYDEGKHLYKSCYLGNITDSPIHLWCSRATCITCIVGWVPLHIYRHGIVSGSKFGVAKPRRGLNGLRSSVAISTRRWWVVVSMYVLMTKFGMSGKNGPSGFLF